MLRFNGSWRITIVSKAADFDQRVVVRGPHGTWTVPGQPGAWLQVDADSWSLSTEHNYPGRGWQPNVRTTSRSDAESNGARSQILTSTDISYAGKDANYPNLVVRLDRSSAGQLTEAFKRTRTPSSSRRTRAGSVPSDSRSRPRCPPLPRPSGPPATRPPARRRHPPGAAPRPHRPHSPHRPRSAHSLRGSPLRDEAGIAARPASAGGRHLGEAGVDVLTLGAGLIGHHVRAPTGATGSAWTHHLPHRDAKPRQ